MSTWLRRQGSVTDNFLLKISATPVPSPPLSPPFSPYQSSKIKIAQKGHFIFYAPAAGIEPATNRLTGDCSTAELHRNPAIIANMYVKVKITPDSKKENVTKVSDDHYEISVKQKAENNKANSRLLEIMHSEFPNSIIRIVSGHHSPSKIVSID